MLFSILYTSIDNKSSEEGLAAIVEDSRPRNQKANITGCLVLAEHRFAQLLEGEHLAVMQLMCAILEDNRHTDVRILQEGPVIRRRFSGWALGYAGPSTYIAKMIAKPLSEDRGSSTRRVLDIIEMMEEFRSERTRPA